MSVKNHEKHASFPPYGSQGSNQFVDWTGPAKLYINALYVIQLEMWNWPAYDNRLLNKSNCWLTGYLKEHKFSR